MLLQAVRCKTGHRCQGSGSIPLLGSWAAGAQDQHPPTDCGQRVPGSAVGTPQPGITSRSVPKEAPHSWGWGCCWLPAGCPAPGWGGGMALATRSCPATLGDPPTAPGAWGALIPWTSPTTPDVALQEQKRRE